MTTARRIVVTVLPLSLLAACADMPAPMMLPVSIVPRPAPPPAASQSDMFIASQRAEARRLDAQGLPAEAKLHWRYVAALVPNDPEATREIARLDGVIRTRSEALLQQGEAALMRGRTAEAQLAFLKVLALDGSNARARARLRELDTRAALTSQAQKNVRDQMLGLTAGTERPID